MAGQGDKTWTFRPGDPAIASFRWYHWQKAQGAADPKPGRHTGIRALGDTRTDRAGDIGRNTSRFCCVANRCARQATTARPSAPCGRCTPAMCALVDSTGVKLAADEARDAWLAFWFRPEPLYVLGIVRIAFGVMTLGWGLSLLPDLDAFFTSHGVLAHPEADAFEWGLFQHTDGYRAVLIGWLILMLAAIALTVGWHSRAAALVVFVLVLSFQYRNPLVFNAGDVLHPGAGAHHRAGPVRRRPVAGRTTPNRFGLVGPDPRTVAVATAADSSSP